LEGPRIRTRAGWNLELSLEAAVEAEPFRPEAGVVLLRPQAGEEAQLQIREAAEVVHLALLVAGAYQQ